ncbi:MAG: glycine cleavage system aminomethyltransferase GcvT [Pseudomonadota bacterium]
MGEKTPIYPQHLEAGAKIVDFGGWDMPIHYGSQIEEHHAIRQKVGVCDVSHMTVVDVRGSDAEAYLLHLISNDVRRLDVNGKALYSGMLNESGGVLDDLIVYRDDPGYRVVVNCATREKDLKWMQAVAASFSVEVTEQPSLAILAVQGPDSLKSIPRIAEVAASLKPFTSVRQGDWFIARTGYTGEPGIEVILPGTEAVQLWSELMAAGVAPVGLGARDTLRLEAGMNLYGSDMDESVTPLESNMAFTAVLENHSFVGSEALRAQLAAGVPRELIGLVMVDRGVLRSHYPVFSADLQVGEITSGAFSPTLGHSIALARVTSGVSGPLHVEIRGKKLPVYRVKLPFVRNGKRVYKPIDNIG